MLASQEIVLRLSYKQSSFQIRAFSFSAKRPTVVTNFFAVLNMAVNPIL